MNLGYACYEFLYDLLHKITLTQKPIFAKVVDLESIELLEIHT